MLVDPWRLCLLEAQTDKPGYGLVRFVADLNNVIACPESHNTRALAIVIRQPSPVIPRGAAAAGKKQTAHQVIFSGRFVFDDHIRCVAALQYLERGRANLRAEKLCELESLLGMAKPGDPEPERSPKRPWKVPGREPNEDNDSEHSAIIAEPDTP